MNKVYFHHFHKCAGTSVINWLQHKNKPKFANINGNPVDGKGVAYPLHILNAEQFICFVENSLNSDWFAYEWGIPRLEAIKDRFYLCTVFREPRERMRSNYSFDYTNAAVRIPLSEYVSNTGVPFWYENFYYEQLSSYAGRSLSSEEMVVVVKELFDEVWVVREGVATMLWGDGLLDQALSKSVRSNVTRSRFRRRPRHDCDLNDYCQIDSDFFEQLSRLCSV